MSLADLFIALAVYGRRTWTHGGGPGFDGLPAGVMGTPESTVVAA
ncbi:hypothetical protein ACF07V_14725 [Streptomyces sp. NPDC015661]